MLLSVIIPVYNVEKYLEECLDSILGQSFSDFEVILVDDGSKDNSGKIGDAYAQRDSRIQVIHKENGGQASARNTGAAAAAGEYIVFLDSDDFLIGDRFFADIAALEGKSDVICCKFQKYFDNEKRFEDCTFSYANVAEKETMDARLLQMVKDDAYFGMAWAKAVRRKLLTDNGIAFDTTLVCEDMDWFYRVITAAKSLALIDVSYIAYRQREGSVTKTVKLKNVTDFIITLEKWSAAPVTLSLSEEMQTALRGSLAKYYTNMLINYVRVSDPAKKAYMDRIKKLGVLLDASLSARPIKVHKLVKLTGIGGALLFLGLADKVRR